MTKFEVISQRIINCQYSAPQYQDEGGGYITFIGYDWEDAEYQQDETGTVIEVDEHGYFNQDYWRFVKDVEWYIEQGYIRKI
jgi:hypothetical protein